MICPQLTPRRIRTWADWSATFDCPVYMAEIDSGWANRKSHPSATLKLLQDATTELLPGLTSIICGGHFPGSQCLHSAPPNTPVPTLFVADTIFAAASSHNPDPGKRGDTISYGFLWSIPNIIPLPPDDVLKIWGAIKPFEFKATYGVMAKVTNVCKSILLLWLCWLGSGQYVADLLDSRKTWTVSEPQRPCSAKCKDCCQGYGIFRPCNLCGRVVIVVVVASLRRIKLARNNGPRAALLKPGEQHSSIHLDSDRL